jgi:putative phosphoesterase
MRIAILSDAHGNAVATGRCLAAATAMAPDAIYFIGDAVGYLPGEREVLGQLAKAGVSCQSGNHEAMILGRRPTSPEREAQYQHRSAAARLGDAGLAALRSWPDRKEIDVGGRRVLLVHGNPSDSLDGHCYPDSDIGDFSELPFDAVAMGHTHRAFVRQSGSVTAINVGSCGLPRDQGDAPTFAVYDSDTNSGAIYRVRVTPEEVLSAYDGYPIHDAVRACLLRTSPGAIGKFVLGS